jgi:hypothetical protein
MSGENANSITVENLNGVGRLRGDEISGRRIISLLSINY